MKKRFLVFIIALVGLVTCVMGLTACGEGSPSNAKEIRIGHNKEYVRTLMGKPFEETEYSFTYYGSNYTKLIKESEKLGKEYEKAVNNLDFEKMISLELKMDKLYEKAAKTQTVYTYVGFTKGGNVEEVIHDKNYGGLTDEVKSTKENPATITVTSDYQKTLSIRIDYPDGSMKLKNLTGIDYVNKGAVYGVDKGDLYEFAYTDSWGEYSTTHYSDNVTKVVIPAGTTNIKFTNKFSPDEVWFEGSLADWCGAVESIDVAPDVVYFNGEKLSGDVVIPDGVTQIPASTFSKCMDLTSVVIPNSVTSIGKYAFYDCKAIETIEIPNSVTNIGDNAFYGCDSLESIVIPESVTSIGERSFYACDLLKTVTFGGNCQITTLPYEVFAYCTALENIVIPESVTTIDDYALYNCDSLDSIVIPESVKKIERSAIVGWGLTVKTKLASRPNGWDENWTSCPVVWNCDNNDVANDGYIYTIVDDVKYMISQGVAIVTYQPLSIKTANIKESITYKGSTYPVNSIERSAFSGCTNLTTITIPNSITNIGSGAFANCLIKKASVPAFACEYIRYSPLEELTITGGDTIEEGIFLSAPIKKATLPAFAVKAIVKKGYVNKTLEEVVITSGTSIGDYMFNSCEALKTIVIPNSVTSIGANAFYGCKAIETIEIPNSVTSIGNAAFAGSVSLKTIVIPNSVTSIGESAFNGCTSLKTITFESGSQIKTISKSMFSSCTALESVTIPYGVTSIANYAFYHCDSLQNVVIPYSVTSIGERAFNYCGSLQKIVIPATVSKMGQYVFLYCDVLTIYCEHPWAPNGWDSWWNAYRDAKRPVVWEYYED